ncbi:hypothetical protein C2W62_49840, partial [Candidatus Entotheonella serta]
MMANPVFSHLTVLELAQGVSGPYATMQLADFGARVIKIEPPQGDWSRAMGPAVRGRGKRVGFGSESQQRKHGCRSHPNRESRCVSRPGSDGRCGSHRYAPGRTPSLLPANLPHGGQPRAASHTHRRIPCGWSATT